MKIEKREMTVRELVDYIATIVSIALFIGIAIAPFLWLLGVV